MILSPDYTRVAVLSDSIITKLMERYPYRGDLGFDGIKALNNSIKEMMEHRLDKVDLVTEWIIRSLDKGSGRYPEDFSLFMNSALFFLARNKEPRFKEAVKQLSESKGKSFNFKNILDFTLHDIYELEDIYKDEPVDPKINQLQNKLPEGAELFYNDGKYQFIKVFSDDAACQLARGTKWCTSNKKIAREYLDNSPLYIIYQGGKKIAQLHIDDEMLDVQIMDLRDRSLKLNRGLRDAFIKSGLMERLLGSVDYYGEGVISLIGDEPDPLMENLCLRNPMLAFLYAKLVVKGRFPQGEIVIAKDSDASFMYASSVIYNRFPDGEEAIASPPMYNTKDYAMFLYEINPIYYEDFINKYHISPRILGL